MTRTEGKQHMARLAAIELRMAELDGERAQLGADRARIFRELADGETVDLRTLRAVPRRHVPDLGVIDELTMARAERALQRTDSRRRVR